jgi:transcriptional regulator with AAA-type ATPase domain
MVSIDESGAALDRVVRFEGNAPVPGLLLVYGPPRAFKRDFQPIEGDLTIGRRPAQGLALRDDEISREHVRIFLKRKRHRLEDLGSRNGTFVNGRRVVKPVKLDDQAVIRVGRVLLVFHEDLRPVFAASRPPPSSIIGRFHSARLVGALVDASRSRSHLLLAGPRGCGKELAAKTIATLLAIPLVVQDAARFASAVEAQVALFGVGREVFPDVSDRQGYIERADGGVLLLHRAHALPGDVQQSLLKVVETGRLMRIGETDERQVDVRFVFSTTDQSRYHGLSRDLLALLRMLEIPSLSQRVADIPDIFAGLLQAELIETRVGLPRAEELLSEVHFQALMVDGFSDDNVRGLTDLADRICSRIAAGDQPQVAIAEVFTGRFKGNFRVQSRPDEGTCRPITIEAMHPVKARTAEQALVEEAYYTHGGGVEAIERVLRAKGVDFSQKRIAKILDELGLERNKGGKG